MRLGEQHRSGDAVGLELKEAVADDRQSRFVDRAAAQGTQCIGLRQQRFVGRATVPFTQEMDSFHRINPPGAIRAGVFRIPEQPLPMCWARQIGRDYAARPSVYSIPLPRARAKSKREIMAQWLGLRY